MQHDAIEPAGPSKVANHLDGHQVFCSEVLLFVIYALLPRLAAIVGCENRSGITHH